MTIIDQAGGYALAILLVGAALGKLLAFADVRKALLSAFSTLNPTAAAALVMLLVLIEAVLGAMLLAAPSRFGARVLAGSLFFAFALYGLFLSQLRPGSTCACFGGSAPVSRALPMRNVGLSVIAFAFLDETPISIIVGSALVAFAFYDRPHRGKGSVEAV